MKLASTYAMALIELKNFDEIYEDLKNLLKCFDENLEFEKIMNLPTVSKVEKNKIIGEIVKDNQNLLNFLKVLIDNNRFMILREIFFEYENLYYREKDTLLFKIKSTQELSYNDIEKIKNSLFMKYKKNIIIENIIDKNLIGGIVIYHENKVIDFSIINQLLNIKNNIV